MGIFSVYCCFSVSITLSISADGKTESHSDEEGADDITKTPLPPSSSRLPTPKLLPAIHSSAKDSDTKTGLLCAKLY